MEEILKEFSVSPAMLCRSHLPWLGGDRHPAQVRDLLNIRNFRVSGVCVIQLMKSSAFSYTSHGQSQFCHLYYLKTGVYNQKSLWTPHLGSLLQ